VISCASNLPNVAHIRSQEEVPGPIWVASLANDGFMAHHLRAQEQHVAPGDVILALDGKAVVSTPVSTNAHLNDKQKMKGVLQGVGGKCPLRLCAVC